MPETILVLNAGSSSIKFQLFAVDDDDRLVRRLKGQIDGIGTHPHLRAKGKDVTLAQWGSPDFVAIAKAFGGDGVLLRSESEIGAAVATGLKKGGLYVIDARVSPTTVSDPYQKIHFGQANRAPLLRRPERVA